MHISAKADYAVRACVHLASVSEGPTKTEAIALAQQIPGKFLEQIMTSLTAAGVARSQRGAHGGYWLAVPAAELTVAEIIRAVDGPLASVRGQRPEDVVYAGVLAPLATVWLAVRSSLREVLEHVTVADVARGELPPGVVSRATEPEVRTTRPTSRPPS